MLREVDLGSTGAVMEGKAMQDLKAKREKFLADAADCELIGSLANDPLKRATFRKLAAELRRMIAEIDAAIGRGGGAAAAGEPDL